MGGRRVKIKKKRKKKQEEEKREQKEFSLNLKTRLEERKIEREKGDSLKEKQEAFEDLSFPSRKITLSVVEEQIDQSRKARGLDLNSTKDEDGFVIPENFDLQLNESLNILTDYLEFTQPSGSALRQFNSPQDI